MLDFQKIVFVKKLQKPEKVRGLRKHCSVMQYKRSYLKLIMACNIILAIATHYEGLVDTNTLTETEGNSD
jgi:hypothetical protein